MGRTTTTRTDRAEFKAFAVSDPGTNVAVSTAVIDNYSIAIITTTTTGNAQTIQSPTDTADIIRFTVVNNDTSSDAVVVNSISIAPGNAKYFIWDGSAWVDDAGAAGFATTALDNLASVAINTSLVSDTADTDSLGSTTKEWLNLYIGDAGKIYIGLGQDLSIHRSAANEMTLTASAGIVASHSLSIPNATGGDLLTLGATTDAASPRVTMLSNNSGYAAPSAAGSNSNGDKYVFWNKVSVFKGAIGMNANEMWFQAMGVGTDKFRFYGGDATTPSEILQLGEADTIFNAARADRDYAMRRVTSGDAYKYDFGAESHTYVGSVALLNSVPLTLGTASAAAGGVILQNASNANTVTVQSGVTSTTYALTLPLAVATAGQVLTDAAGDGVLSWETCDSVAWNNTRTNGTGAGLTHTIGASAASGVTSFATTINNTQSNVLVANSINLGTSALGHTGLAITAQGASTSQKGVSVGMGAGTGIGYNVGGTGAFTGFKVTGASGIDTGFLYTFTGSDPDGTAFKVDMVHNGFIRNFKVFDAQIQTTSTGAVARTVNLFDLSTDRNGGVGSVNDNFDLMSLKRSYTSTGGTKVNSGAVLKLENASTPAGLTDNVIPLEIVQDVDGKGVPIDVTQNAVISTNYRKLVKESATGVIQWVGNSTDPNGTLTGTAGDFLVNGANNRPAISKGTTVWATVLDDASTVSALTTVGTITSGIWNAGAVTSSGAVQGTTGVFTAASSLTLGTASSADGGIIYKNATNANTVTVQSGATSGTYALTLPLAVGGAGTVLTDAAGDGVLSWVASGVAWGDSITSTSGTGTTITVANSSDASTTGQKIVIGDTQANAVTGLEIDTGSAVGSDISAIVVNAIQSGTQFAGGAVLINEQEVQAVSDMNSLSIGLGFNKNSSFKHSCALIWNEDNAGSDNNTGIVIKNYSTSLQSGAAGTTVQYFGAGVNIVQDGIGGTALGIAVGENIASTTYGIFSMLLTNSQSSATVMQQVSLGTSAQGHSAYQVKGANPSTSCVAYETDMTSDFTGKHAEFSKNSVIKFQVLDDGEIGLIADITTDVAPEDDTTLKKLTLQKLAAPPTNAAYFTAANNPGTDVFYLVVEEG